ncbi:MAG: signal peptide peptidase SppA [Planctomycetes bacterium]|jgi:protease-4|nr:signal peptide peptidase SppA [Planctomycetota bacterium]
MFKLTRPAAVLLLLLLIAPPACGPMTITIGGPNRGIEETTVDDPRGHGGDKIAIIDISGLLINAEKPGLLQAGENPVSLLHEQLRHAAEDDDVKAIVLRLNTPGGGVTASDIMYGEVQRFRAVSGKPVVAMAMDVTASGGYYLACAADRIVAQPTSVVGSIGVIVQTVSIKPALQRWGVEAEAITSGPNKAAGSPLEVMTDEHRAVLRGLVDDFYARFVTVVREARPQIDGQQFDTVTDGRVMSGRRALAAGLVDEVGDIYDAAAAARALAGIDRAKLVVYHRPADYAPSPYAADPTASRGGTQINLAQVNLSSDALTLPAGFYYLWRPTLP